MSLRRKYRIKSNARLRHSSLSYTSGELLDEVGTIEAVRAASAAVTALADTLNALGLRIALGKNTYGSAEDSNPSYYNRLALLAESASGQVGGIQKLLRAIEQCPLCNESERKSRKRRRSRC